MKRLQVSARHLAVLAASLLLCQSIVLAQAPDYGGKEQKEALKKLAKMVGTWKGDGFYDAGGTKRPFHGTEIVAAKCEGAILSVEGNHTMTVGDREVPVHSAFGIIFFDDKKKTYQMTAHLANGLNNTYAMTPTDTGYVWEQDHQTMGHVRYTATITADTWSEVGERKDGETWVVFYRMDLRKAA